MINNCILEDNAECDCGDLNQDNVVNILDVVLLVNMVLSNEYNPSGDLNSDGTINILDVVVLIGLILDA